MCVCVCVGNVRCRRNGGIRLVLLLILLFCVGWVRHSLVSSFVKAAFLSFFPRWLFAKINYPRLTFNFSSSSDLSSQKIRRRFLRKAGDWLGGRKWIFVLLFTSTFFLRRGGASKGPLDPAHLSRLVAGRSIKLWFECIGGKSVWRDIGKGKDRLSTITRRQFGRESATCKIWSRGNGAATQSHLGNHFRRKVRKEGRVKHSIDFPSFALDRSLEVMKPFACSIFLRSNIMDAWFKLINPFPPVSTLQSIGYRFVNCTGNWKWEKFIRSLRYEVIIDCGSLDHELTRERSIEF